MVGYNLGASVACRIGAQNASTSTVTHWPQAPYPPIPPQPNAILYSGTPCALPKRMERFISFRKTNPSLGRSP